LGPQRNNPSLCLRAAIVVVFDFSFDPYPHLGHIGREIDWIEGKVVMIKKTPGPRPCASRESEAGPVFVGGSG
jgi:hypothetical protein